MKYVPWTIAAALLVAIGLSTAAAVTGYGPDAIKGFSTSSLLKH